MFLGSICAVQVRDLDDLDRLLSNDRLRFLAYSLGVLLSGNVYEYSTLKLIILHAHWRMTKKKVEIGNRTKNKSVVCCDKYPAIGRFWFIRSTRYSVGL